MALVDVRLPDPPLAQTLEVVISIEQTMRITPFEPPRDERTMPPLTHELRRARLPVTVGKAARLRELVRLPRAIVKPSGWDGTWQQWSPIRSTTLEASQTPIRTSHRLVVELHYDDADGVARILSCGKDILLAHVRRPAESSADRSVHIPHLVMPAPRVHGGGPHLRLGRPTRHQVRRGIGAAVLSRAWACRVRR